MKVRFIVKFKRDENNVVKKFNFIFTFKNDNFKTKIFIYKANEMSLEDWNLLYKQLEDGKCNFEFILGDHNINICSYNGKIVFMTGTTYVRLNTDEYRSIILSNLKTILTNKDIIGYYS